MATDDEIKKNYLDKVASEYKAFQERLATQIAEREALLATRPDLKKTTFDQPIAVFNLKIQAAENTLKEYAKDQNPQIANHAQQLLKDLSSPQSQTSKLDQNYLNSVEKEYQKLLDKKAEMIERADNAKSAIRNIGVKIKAIQKGLNKIQEAGDKAGKPQGMIDSEKRDLQFQKEMAEQKLKSEHALFKQHQSAQKTVETKLDNITMNTHNLEKNKDPVVQDLAKKVTKALEKLDTKFKNLIKNVAKSERAPIPWQHRIASRGKSAEKPKIGTAKEANVKKPPKLPPRPK